ncbi:MAG: hypothetical protein DMF93_25740 [Acidobacteria bacterium]|nr:MAG: hypothetical protein DMF93_25740 [Acidobacteriota bacterium]
MTIDADGRIDADTYWRVEFPRAGEAPEAARDAAIAGVRARVTRAVEKRLVSDVPLGAFLSGGLDSTIVVGVMSRLMAEPVKTFSIGFEGDTAYDETRYARIAAERFRTEHTEFRVAPDAVDLIDTLLWHHDGPFGDSSALPTYLVSKLARAKVTVVLTGDGGDELFAGYRRFRASIAAGRLPRALAGAADAALARLPPPRHERSRLAEARRFFHAAAAPPDIRMTMWNAVFFDDLAALVRPDFAAAAGPIDVLHYIRAEERRLDGLSPLSRLLHANFTSYLPDDLLVKLDRATMANALEARSPFLDRELIEYRRARQDGIRRAGGRLVPRQASRLHARSAARARRALPLDALRQARRPARRAPSRGLRESRPAALDARLLRAMAPPAAGVDAQQELRIWNVEFGIRCRGVTTSCTNSKFRIPNS